MLTAAEKLFNKFGKTQLLEIITSSRTKTDICEKIGYAWNGNVQRFLKYCEVQLQINIDNILEANRIKNPLYKQHIQKICPVCKKEFSYLPVKNKKPKVTCSYACSNTYFRSGENASNYKEDEEATHKVLLFRYHEKKCVVCGENKIIACHHYNGDHDDNRPENLVPLCPTHHCYIHSKYKDEVVDKIDLYVKKYLECHNLQNQYNINS